MLKDLFKFGKDKGGKREEKGVGEAGEKEETKVKASGGGINTEAERRVAEDINKRLKSSVSTIVTEIMVPRIDMTTIALHSVASRHDLVSVIKESGHSRIPVWDKSVDDIVGILYVKDLFHLLIEDKVDMNFVNILRPVFFIPETTNIFVLLKDFQRKKVHLAVVVDEYGGVSGIVALEDVLEEIVGEIRDEYDLEEVDPIEKVEGGVYRLDPRTSLEEINRRLELDLPDEHSDTIGGFMFDLFGRIPNRDERIEYGVGGANLEFKILDIDGNRIEKIELNIRRNVSSGFEERGNSLSSPSDGSPSVY